MSVIDSGQGGPSFSFSSQLGAWKPDGKGRLVAKTLDFSFPSAGVARLDYTIGFSADRTHVTGTIILRAFPLQGEPLDGDGTVLGEFTFAGTFVAP